MTPPIWVRLREQDQQRAKAEERLRTLKQVLLDVLVRRFGMLTEEQTRTIESTTHLERMPQAIRHAHRINSLAELNLDPLDYLFSHYPQESEDRFPCEP
jgi:hypothetical protein